MGKYFLVFKLAILDTLEYRFDFLLHTLKYAFSITVMALVWLAVAKENPLPDLSRADLIIYYMVAAIIYGSSNFHPDYVEKDIKSGQITKLLLRPISPFWYYCIFQSATLFLELVLKSLIFIPVFMWMGVTVGWAQLLIFCIYVPLVFLFCFSLYFSVATLTFWFDEVWSIRFIVMFLTRLLSGMLIPVSLFPVWYQSASPALPFQYLVFTPIQTILNNISLQSALQGLGVLGLWVGVAFALQTFIWHKASQEYEGTGI